MNDRFLKATGLSMGAFFVLLVTNGKALMDALMGFPQLVQAWTAVLPLGVWSSLLALVISMMAWGFAMRYFHPRPDGRAPQLGSDMVSLIVALCVTVTQVAGQPSGVLLQAIWMGVAAGFLAPMLCRMISSTVSRMKNMGMDP